MAPNCAAVPVPSALPRLLLPASELTNPAGVMRRMRPASATYRLLVQVARERPFVSGSPAPPVRGLPLRSVPGIALLAASGAEPAAAAHLHELKALLDAYEEPDTDAQILADPDWHAILAEAQALAALLAQEAAQAAVPPKAGW